MIAAHSTAWPAVYRGADTLGLTDREVWLGQFTMGGSLPSAEVTAFLDGTAPLDTHQFDLLVAALNDELLGRGKGHPLPYSWETASPRLAPAH